MRTMEAVFYARVSSEQQATAQTIQSQIAALRERIVADGIFIPSDREFIDDGYSGATLVRPALERLRDFAAAGEVERIYVHSPDRLARSYAYRYLRGFSLSGVIAATWPRHWPMLECQWAVALPETPSVLRSWRKRPVKGRWLI